MLYLLSIGKNAAYQERLLGNYMSIRIQALFRGHASRQQLKMVCQIWPRTYLTLIIPDHYVMYDAPSSGAILCLLVVCLGGNPDSSNPEEHCDYYFILFLSFFEVGQISSLLSFIVDTLRESSSSIARLFYVCPAGDDSVANL